MIDAFAYTKEKGLGLTNTHHLFAKKPSPLCYVHMIEIDHHMTEKYMLVFHK